MDQFKTFMDTLDSDPGDKLVIMLGDCAIAEGVVASRLLRFADASPQTMSSIGAVDIREYARGIVLVVARKLAQSQYGEVRRIQKYLVFCFMKYVWFATQDSATPDPLGIGGDKGPLADLVYQVNVQENLEYLITHPRAQCLQKNTGSFPVLLLLPGDSLKKVGPHLEELSTRSLVICLSKTLEFCQQHGVTPDIVIQLDTHGQQKNYYPADMDLSGSWLVALSCAPACTYLDRFAGVFWIDTFHPGSYGNSYEMRNSWLSSLIPMLGAAELMRPSRLLVAGADLAYPAKPETPVLSDVENVGSVNGMEFPVRMIDGTTGTTGHQFLATAYEAEVIASEFALNMGTVSFNLTQSGLLDPSVFEPKGPGGFGDLPTVNREAFQVMMARAWKEGQRPDANAINRWVHEQLKNARFLVRQATTLSVMDDPGAVKGNPLLSAAKLVSHLHPAPDDETQLFMSRKVLERYLAILEQRAAGFRLAAWARQGKEAVILGMLDEEVTLTAALRKRFPEMALTFKPSWEQVAQGHPEYVMPRLLPKRLPKWAVVLMSRRYREAGDYLFSLLPMDNVLMAEDVLEAPWP